MNATHFKFLLKVYMDDFVALVVAHSQEELPRVARPNMQAMHNALPLDKKDNFDPTSAIELLKLEGVWDTTKEILGFEFDGVDETMILAKEKQKTLLLCWK